ASGAERTLDVHAHPTDRVIGPGELLRVDVVGYFGGVYTDMARTVVVGRGTPAQRDLYRKVRAVQREVLDRLRPGVSAGDVYGSFLERVKHHGLSFAYRYVGHSTGYEVVEEPVINEGGQDTLLPGRVLGLAVGVTRGAGAAVAGIPADVTQPADVDRVLAEGTRRLGPIDVLVNFAGYAPFSHLLDVSADEWDHVFAVNVKGTMLCCQA